MIPEYMPVFTAAHILIDSEEYGLPDIAMTTMGWLKHLFLFNFDAEHIEISPQDRKDFEKALDIFRTCAKISRKEDIHDWEEKTSAVKQASALNKLRKEMKYVVLEDA